MGLVLNLKLLKADFNHLYIIFGYCMLHLNCSNSKREKYKMNSFKLFLTIFFRGESAEVQFVIKSKTGV